MMKEESIQSRLEELMEFEENLFWALYHQEVENSWEKSWHDHHIIHKILKKVNLVLLYDNKYHKHLGKLRMHWLSPFMVAKI